MILKLLGLFVVIQVAASSVVLDSYGQQGVFMSDYCPSMNYCPEGAHVLCMYYDPKNKYGPHCNDPRNVTITAEVASHLLDISNAIRAKIANGKETGKHHLPLPRGYGMFKLKWDNELATFAQILANQCVLKQDLCRATKKFPNPGQALGMMRLTIPDWKPINKPSSDPLLNTAGLHPRKILNIISQVMKSWYSQKTSVTEEMIEKTPDWSLDPKLLGRPYLELIHAASTHMGCGMTAYTELIYYQRKPINGKPGSVNYNVLLLVCNFASTNKIDQQVYFSTRPPYSSACGCPEGTQEDSDCLCVEKSAIKVRTESIGVQVEPDTCSSPGVNCDSTLVLLPIFTIEDAPKDKLLEGSRFIEDSMNAFVNNRFDNRSNMIQRTKSLEMFDIFSDVNNEHENVELPTILHPSKTAFISSIPEKTRLTLPEVKSVALSLPYNMRQKLKQRESPGDIIRLESQSGRIPQFPRKASKLIPASKKSSLFTRVAKFRLPDENDQYEVIKPDVKPRKNFKNIDRVVNEYIKHRDNKLPNRRETSGNKREGILKSPYMTTTSRTQEYSETILNKAEEKVMDFDHPLQHTLNGSYYNIKHYDARNDENDNKLLNLLDNLEKEVNHIELDGEEKEIFDAKIKKIYGTVVGIPSILTTQPKFKQSLVSTPTPLAERDFLESDIKGSRSHLKHDTNHLMEDQPHTRYQSDHTPDDRNVKKLNTENKNNGLKNYDIFEQQHRDDYEITNDMIETDTKLFKDMNHKYNDREVHNYHTSKLKKKYSDNNEHEFDDNFDDNLDRKYDNLPVSRTQNNIRKVRYKQNSAEDRKHRIHDKYRGRETSPIDRAVDIEKNYYRNAEDNGRNKDIGGKRQKSSFKQKDDELDHEEPLSVERRKYYQEKLENVERRIKNKQPLRRKTTNDRPSPRMMRRMRPNLENADRPRSKAQGDSFYMPDRAKFLHAF